LGANVRAPTQFVFSWSDGRFTIAGKNDPDNGYPNPNIPGGFVMFKPTR